MPKVIKFSFSTNTFNQNAYLILQYNILIVNSTHSLKVFLFFKYIVFINTNLQSIQRVQ